MALPQIVLVDGEATPLSHTFDGAKQGVDYAMWENRSAGGGTYIGWERLIMQITRPRASQKANGIVTAKTIFTFPLLEVLGNSASGIMPPPSLACPPPRIETVFFMPDRMTEQQRKNMRMIHRDLTTNSSYTALIEKMTTPN